MKSLYVIVLTLPLMYYCGRLWWHPLQRSLPIIEATWPLRSRPPQAPEPSLKQFHIYTLNHSNKPPEHLLPQDFSDDDAPKSHMVSVMTSTKKIPKLDELLNTLTT